MSSPERCHCVECRPNLTSRDVYEITRLREAVNAAIEVAYDPGKQPALVLTLIDLGFIQIIDRQELPILEE